MFQNFITAAVRNLFRNKSFSAINVLGLSIGLSAALVIFLIVQFEFSFDRFEKDPERIFRVVMDINDKGQLNHSPAIPAPVPATMEREIAGLEQVVPRFQFQGEGNTKVTIASSDPSKPIVFKQQPNVIFTNDDYFRMLPFHWLAGSKLTALSTPFSVVLTESRAKLYFPSVKPQDVVGRQIVYADTLKTLVTGVVEDIEENSFFDSREFISMATVSQTGLKNNFMMEVWDDWMAYSQTFVKLNENSSPQKIEADMAQMFEKYHPQKKDADFRMTLKLQPLKDVHFNYSSVGQRTASKTTLYGLLAIASFLLLLGCINFINLTTAHAVHRAKEIGIRKTMGGSRFQLILQFLGETFLITAGATLLSVVLTPLLLQVFKDFTPPGLHFDPVSPATLAFLVSITLLVSFLAGVYPALVLSSFKPALVLKKQTMGYGPLYGHGRVRQLLTVSQFVIAQFFVMATMGVSKQIHYSLNKDLGIKKDAIVNFSAPHQAREAADKTGVLLQKIKAIPEIQMASVGFLSPVTDGAAFTNVKFNNGTEDVKADVQIRWGDSNYMKVYGIELVAGRMPFQADTMREYLVNETYARVMGFQNPSDAVGQQLNFNGKMKPVVGVMKDFHEQSLHEAIGPIIFSAVNTRNEFFHIALRPQNVAGSNWQSAIHKMEIAYKEIYPGEDFSYKFFDETIAGMYAAEQNTAKLLRWATGLVILISCLGLLGLVIYISNSRTKEIGVRKVLGATVAQIVGTLSRGFVKLVVLAFLIATPFAWWALHKWLNDFAFRTSMSWWVFALSGAGMLLVALATLSFQTIRAAMANPVNSLRDE